mmetsp:Transcript_18483/g.30251  ORF Transcript_18483/g.30251 Transcript_18483/m.30251 type:complete len:264 (-) Transcript_18483:462-1253(-)
MLHLMMIDVNCPGTFQNCLSHMISIHPKETHELLLSLCSTVRLCRFQMPKHQMLGLVHLLSCSSILRTRHSVQIPWMLGPEHRIPIESFVDNALSSHEYVYTLERVIPMWILAILVDDHGDVLFWNLISMLHRNGVLINQYRNGVLVECRDRVEGDAFLARTVSYLSSQNLMVVCNLGRRYQYILHLEVHVSIGSSAQQEMLLNPMDYLFLDVSQEVYHQTSQETPSEQIHHVMHLNPRFEAAEVTALPTLLKELLSHCYLCL